MIEAKEDARPKDEAKGAARPQVEKRTPEAWARECGHVDPVVGEGKRCSASDMKRWVYLATASHHGWGTSQPIDILITRQEYEEAVDAALSLPIGETHRKEKSQ